MPRNLAVNVGILAGATITEEAEERPVSDFGREQQREC